MLRSIIISLIVCQVSFSFAVNIDVDETNFLLTTQKIDSPYIFNDALDAIHAINNSGKSKINLFVSPGVYWLDNPDDPDIRYPIKGEYIPYAAEILCDTLSIIGISENPEDVIFAVNRGQTQGAIGNYTMLHFKGKSLQTENMTFGNFCNIDLIYPLDTTLNRKKRNDAIVQSQLGICEGTDRLFARNCRFLSRLNLCPFTGARRSLFKDCYFECADDALTSSAVYLDCNFTFYSGKPFYSTAKTGAVFLNCDIHSLVDSIQYLTKIPGMVTLIDTRFTSEHPIQLKWTPETSPVRCYQSNVTLNGNPVKIDQERPELGVDITDLRLLNAFKIENDGNSIYNTYNLLSGNDGWDPLGIYQSIREIEEIKGERFTSLPVALSVESSSRQLEPLGDTLNLIASPILWGNYPGPNDYAINAKWSGPGTMNIEAKKNLALVTTENTFPKEIESVISVATEDGLIGATKINIKPLLKDEPEFIEKPIISLNNSVMKVNYTLSSEGEDESFIVWYRSENLDGVNAVPVYQGKGINGSLYKLTSADNGYYISASVSPKLSDSKQGPPVIGYLDSVITTDMCNSTQENERHLKTSFSEIPVVNGQLGKPGFWNFDSYKPFDTMEFDWEPDSNLSWYYGKATDAATGIGLVQATRGARLSYTPSFPECKTMSVSLIAEPCKGPGQGFGSATGQYMDICIKFDPISLTGYGLRIERTPDYDKAVTFTLVQYNNGIVTPVSEAIASNCFRNPCHISLEINEDSFHATASTDAKPIETTNPDVQPSVSLSAPVDCPSSNTSFVIQHTGTVGASATLLRDLNIIWE